MASALNGHLGYREYSDSGYSNNGYSDSGYSDTVSLSNENSNSGNLSNDSLNNVNSSNVNSSNVNSSNVNSSTANSSTANSSNVNSSTANSSTANSSNVNSSNVNSSNVNSSNVNSSNVNSSNVNSSNVNSSNVNSSTANSSNVNSSTEGSGGSKNSSSSSNTSGIEFYYKEPASNVIAKELTTRNIVNGNHVRYDFKENNTCITYVEFDAERTFLKTTTTVEELKNKSIFVSKNPLGRLYKYVNVWIGDKGAGLPTSLKNGLVGFKVEKAWIKENNVNESLITLQWYNNDWEPLYTKKVGEDNNYAYFESKTPGFSSFAITEYTVQNGNKDEILGEDQIQETLKNIGARDGLINNPMRVARIIMTISLPLFIIIAGYFVVRKNSKKITFIFS
ncbi:MAG TPA: PGF-pre-PGF domain-containing protein [Methanosarcina sp.]